MIVPLPFPIKGIDRRGALAEQPPLTTVDALNVVPLDVVSGRQRGGSRSGMAKWTNQQFADGLPVVFFGTAYTQDASEIDRSARGGEPMGVEYLSEYTERTFAAVWFQNTPAHVVADTGNYLEVTAHWSGDNAVFMGTWALRVACGSMEILGVLTVDRGASRFSCHVEVIQPDGATTVGEESVQKMMPVPQEGLVWGAGDYPALTLRISLPDGATASTITLQAHGLPSVSGTPQDCDASLTAAGIAEGPWSVSGEPKSAHSAWTQTMQIRSVRTCHAYGTISAWQFASSRPSNTCALPMRTYAGADAFDEAHTAFDAAYSAADQSQEDGQFALASSAWVYRWYGSEANSWLYLPIGDELPQGYVLPDKTATDFDLTLLLRENPEWVCDYPADQDPYTDMDERHQDVLLLAVRAPLAGSTLTTSYSTIVLRLRRTGPHIWLLKIGTYSSNCGQWMTGRPGKIIVQVRGTALTAQLWGLRTDAAGADAGGWGMIGQVSTTVATVPSTDGDYLTAGLAYERHDYVENEPAPFWIGALTVATPPQEGTPAMPVVARREVSLSVAGGTLQTDFGNGDGYATLASDLGMGQGTWAQNYDQLYLSVQGDASVRVIDTATASASVLTAASGKGTAPTGPKLLANWRGRLVVVQMADPQNLYASRAGDPSDWDYSQDDAQAAWVLNDGSTAGSVGQPVNALIPASNDLLIVGGDSTLWALQGDPADGGALQQLSSAVGIVSATAWCRLADGSIAFVAADGLYQVSPGALAPQRLGDAYAQFFARVRGTAWCLCAYDRDRDAILVCFTPADPTRDSDGLWFDRRTASCWRLSFPAALAPTSASMVDSDDADRRQLVFGCRDGYVRYLKPGQLDDDGTAIPSFVWMGPIKAELSQQTLLRRIDLGTANCQVDLCVGTDLAGALAAEPEVTEVLGEGPLQRLRTRVRGEVIAVKLSGAGGQGWTYEQGEADVTTGGYRRE